MKNTYNETNDARICAAKVVIKNIEKSLEGIPKTIYPQYSYTKVRIDGTEFNDYEDYMYIWITLVWNSEKSKFSVHIDNITLQKEYRHKGIFTKLISRLKKCKYVESVMVTNVLTDEMHQACRKLKMTYIERVNSYIL